MLFSLSRYLNVFLDFLVMEKNGLKFLSKFMPLQPEKHKTAIHVLPFIWRSKDNQTMKFGQLIEYNMRNIFPEKSYTKFVGETNLRPFSKKSKLNIHSLISLYAKFKAMGIY